MGVKLSFQLIILQWTIECIIYILVICNGHFLYNFINLAISIHLSLHRGQGLHWTALFVMTFEYMLSNFYLYIYCLKFKTIFYCSL
jgi:hypothetical protein